MTSMKARFIGLAVTALLVFVQARSGHAEDAAAPAPSPAPATTQTEAPPPSVARPSIVSKPAEPASPPAADKTAGTDTKRISDERPRQRRYAHRHHRRYGYYRTAYWQPFPIYWPHFSRHRIYWSRIPWSFRF
jgi:hypothetical protein